MEVNSWMLYHQGALLMRGALRSWKLKRTTVIPLTAFQTIVLHKVLYFQPALLAFPPAPEHLLERKNSLFNSIL